MKNHISLLISSYHKTYDIWYITDYFLQKHWKSNELKIYLGANGENKKEHCPQNWIYINKGKDESFSKSLKSYLEEIQDEYFILMLDDFLILERVDNNLINKAFDFIKKQNGLYLRLTPNPKGDIKINEFFSKIDVKSRVPYITSLQMAIWKKDFLIKLLKHDFTPWEFETKAGKTQEALENYDKFFVTNFPFVKYTHFIEKGKFYPFIREILKKERLPLNSTRLFLSERELSKMKDSSLKKFIRKLFPSKYINLIRKIFGRDPL